MTLRIGTSGYVYDHWRRLFYPPDVPARAFLAHYATFFDCVELNATFYRLPTPGSAARWAAEVPRDFRFAVKGSRFLTHMKRLLDRGPGVLKFFDAIADLGRKRGPILWQLPPRMTLDVPRLDAFLEALPRGPHAFEFRDDEWYCDEVYDVLDTRGAAVVVHDLVSARMPWPPPGPFVYQRFHGATGKYTGRYGPAGLRIPAKRLANLGKDAWVFFNNDLGGHALSDAFTLKALLGIADEKALESPVEARS